MVSIRRQLDGFDVVARRLAGARTSVAEARRRLRASTAAREELAARLADLERLASGVPAARVLLERV
jgi:hypothetical protein